MNHENLKKQIIKYLDKGIRFDGRKPDEFRKIGIEYNISGTAEGSAKVTMGETIVMAGVKMAVESPYPDTPDEGMLMVGAELLPMSSPDFEAGPPDIKAIELARVIDRGIRESKAIDTKSLCIKKGEKVWSVMIDLCTINEGGNLLDACGLAAIAAIQNARFPKYEDDVLDYKEKTDKKLPLLKVPVPVTVYKIGEHIFVDPINDEELAVDARLTVTGTADKTISALQKGGDLTLSVEDIDKMVTLGLKKAEELRKHLD